MRSVTAAGICLSLRGNHATKVRFHKDPAKVRGQNFSLGASGLQAERSVWSEAAGSLNDNLLLVVSWQPFFCLNLVIL